MKLCYFSNTCEKLLLKCILERMACTRSYPISQLPLEFMKHINQSVTTENELGLAVVTLGWLNNFWHLWNFTTKLILMVCV